MYIPPAPLRAFISGTQRDLRSERDRAARVLKGLGFEVLRAETATSAAASSESVCEGFASSCDLYVGIFGLSYGTIPPGQSVSVTEMEFDVARAADPAKILVFRKAGTPDPRQQEFLRRVGDFADGYFRAAPFDATATLGTQLRRAVHAWLSERRRSTRDPLDIVYDESVNKTGPTTDTHIFPGHTWRLFRVKVVNRGPETLDGVTVRLARLSPPSNVSIGSPFCVTDDGAEPVSLHPGGMQPIDIVFALLTGPSKGHLYFHLPKSGDRRFLPGGKYRGTLVATGRNVESRARTFTLAFEGGAPPAFKLGGSVPRRRGGGRRR